METNITVKKRGLDATTLKIIAIICMVVDHVAWTFVPAYTYPAGSNIMHFIGRFTFPIMAFFIAVGYKKTSSVPKYLLRLFVLSVVSIVPFSLLFFNVCGYLLNTIFTLFFGLCALYFAGKVQKKVIKGLIVFAFMAVSIIADAGVSGVLLIYMLGTITDPRKACIYGITTMNILDVLITFFFGGLPAVLDIGFIVDIIGTFAVIPLLISYNGNRGKSFKYFFYIFYPAHLLILFG